MDTDDVAALAAIRERLEAAENAGDASAFEDSFADDAVILPPYRPAVVGKAACLDFVRGVLREIAEECERHRPIHYEPDEVLINGDVAIEHGTLSQVLVPKTGGPLMPENGKYLVVYVRHDRRRWQVLRVMSAMDPPPEASND